MRSQAAILAGQSLFDDSRGEDRQKAAYSGPHSEAFVLDSLVHYECIRPLLDERRRRLWAANEAIRFGQGGIRAVAEALGMSQMTLVAGVKELKADPEPGTEDITQRQRRRGGGRKSVTSKSPEIIGAIEKIIDANTVCAATLPRMGEVVLSSV